MFTPEIDEIRCSAKGCRSAALYGIRWNNPKLHSPQRRKVWLACEEHRANLEDFLRMRSFFLDCVPVDDLEATDG